MGHDPPPATSRFRAFTASLGLTSAMSRSSSDQSSSPLRPVSASSLRSLYGNFTLYLRVHSAQQLAAVTQGSYCKIYLGDTPLLGGFGQGKSLVKLEKHARQGSSHQTFHTKVQMSAKRGCPEWNEKFQMNVREPKTEVLTIRVKNHVLLYSPAIGACVVHLRQLQLGVTLDEWFPLYKNDKPSGQLRLQMCLQESVQSAGSERRYSQPSEEIMQRMIQEHREQQENARREVERKQHEKWKQMHENEMKLVGRREQKEREDKWSEQCKSQEKKRPQQEQHDSDSDLPASFKNRGVKEEEDAAAQLMRELQLKESAEGNQLSSAVSSGYTVFGANSSSHGAGFADRELTSFGTIRLSVEDLDQVVHNALPTSDSSDAMSEQERHRRLRKNRDDKKRSRRRPKKHSRRRSYSDGESSDTSSRSSREAQKYSLRSKVAEEKRPTMPESESSLSQLGNQNENRQDWEIPNTLSFPPSTSDDLSSSDEESRRYRRRRAEKARKREKEKKRRSKRKTAKYRGTYDSSESSSYFSSSLSSSLSSSEEERLRRKLKKKKAKKAKARAMLGESGGSRASTRTSGMQQSHKLSYADSRGIDFIPCMTQQPRLDTAATNQTNGGGSSQPESTVTSSSFESSTAHQQPLHSSKISTDYGPDGVGFDKPDKPPMPQYPRQATNEQTDAGLMRSFCF